VWHAAEQQFGGAPRRFAQHGEEGGSLREPHVPSALLYGLDDLVGHFLAGDVDDEPRAVEAPPCP